MNLIKWLISLFKPEPEPKPEPYVEEDTKCDLCEHKGECSLLEITTLGDSRMHFISSPFNKCVKEGDSD